jgi:hypothetical protein
MDNNLKFKILNTAIQMTTMNYFLVVSLKVYMKSSVFTLKNNCGKLYIPRARQLI